jgi:hypothetical protein
MLLHQLRHSTKVDLGVVFLGALVSLTYDLNFKIRIHFITKFIIANAAAGTQSFTG